jgi:hypothetical protein
LLTFIDFCVVFLKEKVKKKKYYNEKQKSMKDNKDWLIYTLQRQKNSVNRSGLWCLMPLSTIFQYIMVVSFIGGGNRRKATTCRKSLTNFIT